MNTKQKNMSAAKSRCYGMSAAKSRCYSTAAKSRTYTLLAIILFTIASLSAQATPGLVYTLIEGGTAYEVAKGTATATNVIIPETHDGLPVTAIADAGFYNYTTMVSVSIPNSVTSFGQSAFEMCSALTSVTLPNNLVSIPEYAFFYCQELTSITIPTSVESIGPYAFEQCVSLGSVTFAQPSTITTIYAGAFIFCTSLTSITIPSSVTSIGSGAFSCTSLDSVTFSEPCNITTIDYAAFAECPLLTSIIIPTSVTHINNFAFEACTSLSSVIFAEPSNLLHIGDEAFYSAALTTITIPSSVESISQNPFTYNTNLETIMVHPGNTYFRSEGNCLIRNANQILISGTMNSIIPSTVTTIGEFAFAGATGLASISIPNSVTDIEWGAFHGCISLVSLSIPSSVVYIGPDVFVSCTGLESIFIPSSVIYMGDWVFYYNPNLTIYAEAESQPAGWHVNWNPQNRPVVWGYVFEEFPAPANLTAIQEGEVIYLEWDIYERQLWFFTIWRNGELLTEVATTFFTDESITNNTLYNYQIKAHYENPDGESALSNTATLHTKFSPQNLSYTFTGFDVELFWDAPNGSGVTGYNVYRDDALLTPTPLPAGFDGGEYTDTTAELMTIYTYQVTALYAAGESQPISITLLTSGDVAFNPPRFLEANIGNGFIHLTWMLPEVVPGIPNLILEGFRVYRDGTLLANNLLQTQYQDATAANQATFNYHVTAIYTYNGGEMESEPSNTVNITARYPIRNLSALSMHHDVKLDWEAPVGGGGSGYNVYRNAVLLNTTPLLNTTFTDDNTTPAAMYIYSIKAVYGTFESPGVDTTIIIPMFSPVGSLTADVNENSVALSWLEPTDILPFEILQGYKIYRDESLLNEALVSGLSYLDNNVPNGVYIYRVIAVYELGDALPAEVPVTVDFVGEGDLVGVSLVTSLHGNYPNPFNPSTNVSFSLAVSSLVRIEIYNIKGQMVRVLVDEYFSAGVHSVTWDGLDDKGHSVGSGMYFCRMSAGDFVDVKRMTVLK